MQKHIRRADMQQLGPVIEQVLKSGQEIRLTVTGNSMYPMLRNGKDSVRLGPVPETLEKYDLPLYRRKTGEYVLHRIVSKSGLVFTMAGDNQMVLETPILKEQIVAVAKGFYRKDRYVSCNNWLYLAYARIWTWLLPHRHSILAAYISTRRLFAKVKRGLQ